MFGSMTGDEIKNLVQTVNGMKAQIAKLIVQCQAPAPVVPLELWMNLFNVPAVPALDAIWGVPPSPSEAPAPPMEQPRRKDKGKHRGQQQSPLGNPSGKKTS